MVITYVDQGQCSRMPCNWRSQTVGRSWGDDLVKGACTAGECSCVAGVLHTSSGLCISDTELESKP